MKALEKAKIFVKNISTSEVAEALIATWCVEFLRARKFGGFNTIQVIAISVLMLGVKTIVQETGRRRYSDKDRAFVMSDKTTQMGTMGSYRNTANSDWRVRHGRRHRQPIY